MKKKMLSLALMTIFISLMALGSAAYFTVEGRATNVITTGEVALTLTETSTDGTVKTDEEGNFIGLVFDRVMPSQTLDKHPMIENTGTQPFWVRVKVSESLKNAAGEDLPLAIAIGEEEIPVLTYNGNDGWIDANDGWLYYENPVEAGASVEVFSSVTLASQMGNEYQDSTGLIEIQAQAVQYKNNESNGDILTVQGWPEIAE